MSRNWKQLEDHVRGIAELRWKTACKPEHLQGVDVDGVVRVSDGEIVLIEITKERNLDKVRSDLSKLLPIRLNLSTQGIICRCYIVLSEEPTNSMTEAGVLNHIPVISISQFEREFFDFRAYHNLRLDLPFGSAVDSKTGSNDSRAFINVKYAEKHRDNRLDIQEISNKLRRGGRIVLVGDFGTGKSRCIKEVYAKLSTQTKESGAYPIAINLRDHWSSSNALEIIAGHLGNVGLSSSIDNTIRLLNNGNLILLLDGFDEIGTQSHDTRINDRKALRKHAVRGLRDLVAKSKNGILITGRSHFFDSDNEMLESLGLAHGAAEVSIIEAPNSFTISEGEEYFKVLGINAKVPEWLPRKPLVFQVIAELDANHITRILSQQFGDSQFWGTFINAVCDRESKGVGNSISPLTVREILLDLAAKSRHSTSYLGRLSPKDIDDSYEQAVRTAPDENGRQLLSRMCTLARIEPESPDRQFIDDGIIEILRAESLIENISAMDDRENQVQWKQSLTTLGVFYAATAIRNLDLAQLCFSYLRKYEAAQNTKKLGEVVSILNLAIPEPLDFKGLRIYGSEIPFLDLIDRKLSNLTIESSIIQALLLDRSPIAMQDNFRIIDSLIVLAAGVSSSSGLPKWIQNVEVVDFDQVSNAARIKESPIHANQKLFLSIIHKIFFQPGAGREEASLSKGGYGQRFSPKLVDAILRIMKREGLVDRFKGDDGWVYTPVRRHTERMARIRSELTLSDDPVWAEVATLRD